MEEKSITPVTFSVSCGRKIVQMTLKQLHHSKFLSSVASSNEENDIPISDKVVSDYAFDKCVEWLKMKEDNQWSKPHKYLSGSFEKNWKDEEDRKFMTKIHQESNKLDKIYEVIKAANYLSIEPLIHLSAVFIHSFVNGTKLSELDV